MNEEQTAQVDVAGQGSFRRVEVKRTLNAPIQRVWQAITTADEVAQWWAPGVIEPREGGKYQLAMDTEECEGLPLEGTIKVFQAPHVLEYTWNDDYVPAEGLVRIELLEIDEDQTLLILIQSVPEKDAGETSKGWQEITDSLANFLE
jgi:uncharacterized protein YndB with AHSA1/START domain